MSAKYVNSSSFTLSGSALSELPVIEFSNLGMQSSASDQVSGTTRGIIQRDSTPGPVRTLNPKITLAATDSKAIHDWYNRINSYDKPKMEKKDLKLDALDSQSNVIMSFQIKQCYPINFTVSSMKAGDSTQVTETIELVAQEVKREK